MGGFVNLHNHTMGSLLDGFSTPEEAATRAASLGQPAIAITDHGSMSCALKFSQACNDVGVKPLIGIEAYICDDVSVQEKDSPIYHIVLIAKTNSGLKKLYKISDFAWNRGFYKKPRVDWAFLRQLSDEGYIDDVVALTGCIDGLLPRAILGERDVKETVELLGVFSNLYVEIQPWNPGELNQRLMDVADHHNLPIVVTADSHYATPDDKTAAEVGLLLSQITGFSDKEKNRAANIYKEAKRAPSLMERINILWPNRRLRFDRYTNHILSREEIEGIMKSQGIDDESIYDNTLKIAEGCDAAIETDLDVFPKFSKMFDSAGFLEELAFEKLQELGLASDETYYSRLRDEVDIVVKLGFSDYFLVIWDIVHNARANGIMVGPGRGSVGGSLLAYVLGITEIDPIKFNLIFWRFLNVDVSSYNPKFVAIGEK